MHYGKYVAQYLKRTFFFDANPPLGKLLIASVAHLADFDGKKVKRNKTVPGSWVCGDRVLIDRLTDRNSDR